jgi:hypothetical protein
MLARIARFQTPTSKNSGADQSAAETMRCAHEPLTCFSSLLEDRRSQCRAPTAIPVPAAPPPVATTGTPNTKWAIPARNINARPWNTMPSTLGTCSRMAWTRLSSRASPTRPRQPATVWLDARSCSATPHRPWARGNLLGAGRITLGHPASLAESAHTFAITSHIALSSCQYGAKFWTASLCLASMCYTPAYDYYVVI